MSDPWREPVRGGYPDPRFFAQTGTDQLRAMLDGLAVLDLRADAAAARAGAGGEHGED